MKIALMALFLTACSSIETESHSTYKDLFCFGLCFTHDAKLDTQTSKTKETKK